MSVNKFKHEKVEERSDSSSIEVLIERSGCSQAFYALETCMGESESRNWSSCQAQVKALKLCNQREVAKGTASSVTKEENNTK
jgi:hypothetical protein